ncbi:hypothetical protein [Roseivirga sp. 4D4]|uniref:hypothetical protein n=1 Tax=Roseivirga sp. 4D4 TaxID=1889784 RepID=UPI000AD0B501|nr:hypothetical protein [Roseivirga sp. 4D4]
MIHIRSIFTTCFLIIFSTTLSAQINYLELPKDRQFDFWIGEWDVNLRVKQADNSWKDDIKSIAKIYSINDGRAILELWNDQRPNGIKGFSLRYYNFESEQWDLWLNWPNQNYSALSSMSGNFRHGRGEFWGGNGDTLSVYTFSDITPYYLRWDDAFTSDGGKNWRNNWIMEFTRTAETPDWPEGERAHTYDVADRCDLPEFSAFRDLKGNWVGTVKEKIDNKWKEGKAEMKGFEVLNGCAVLNFMTLDVHGDTSEHFSIKSYNFFAKMLEDGQIGDREEDNLRRYFGKYSQDSKIYEMEESTVAGKLIKKYRWDLSESGVALIQVFEGINGEKIEWTKVTDITLQKN